MLTRSEARRTEIAAGRKNLILPLPQTALRRGAAFALCLLMLGAHTSPAFADMPEPRRVVSITEILSGTASGYGSPAVGTASPASTAAIISSRASRRDSTGLEGSAKIVSDYLKNTMGFNSAAAAGVLANLQSESSFDPTAVGDGGSAFGLCQWKGARKEALLQYCRANGLDASTMSAQLEFMNKELTDAYPETLRLLRGSRNDSAGADNAAYFFCTDYEAPSMLDTELILRCALARDYFALLSKYESQELSMTQIEAELITADFLRNELKFNAAVTAGIMSNIMAESGFDPGVIGDRGTSCGICQWSGSRYDSYIKFCKRSRLDDSELYSQLAFLKYELTHEFPETMRLLRTCENNSEGARYATYVFCKNYEAPRNLSSALRPRTDAALNVYYPMLSSSLGDTQMLRAASDRAEEYIQTQSSVGIGSVCPPELDEKLQSCTPREIYTRG